MILEWVEYKYDVSIAFCRSSSFPGTVSGKSYSLSQQQHQYNNTMYKPKDLV